MACLTFSISEAANIAIQTLGTFLSVLLGGWLAFRFALKQLRHERAFDRRLQWYEQLLAALDTHSAALRKLATYEEAAEREELPIPVQALEAARFEATESGRAVQDALAGAKLYASAGVVRFALALEVSQIIVWSWIRDTAETPDGRTKRKEELAKHVADLASYSKDISAEVRKELGLPALSVLPPPAFTTPRAT